MRASVKAAEIMSRSVVTLAPDMTLEQAAERLVQHGVSGPPWSTPAETSSAS